MAARLVVSTLIAFTVALQGVEAASHACSKRQPTSGTSRGPHDFSGAPAETNLWRQGDDGEPLLLRARVLDTCGKPVAGARVQILHANQDGDHEPDRWRADLRSDERGEFEVITVYPGYAGSMARHIHFIITHPGHPQLVTRLFFKKDPAIDTSIEDLAIVLEVVQRGEEKGWIGGYEFVLAPK
jgi:protocatechuate 3,4-dioxygenase beta subunit